MDRFRIAKGDSPTEEEIEKDKIIKIKDIKKDSAIHIENLPMEELEHLWINGSEIDAIRSTLD
jgi:hypothetical protein